MSTHATPITRIAPADCRARVARLRAWCCVAAMALLLCSTAAFAARTRVVAWGGEVGDRRLDVPYSLDDAIAVAVPYVLRANGDVVEIGTLPVTVRARNVRAIASSLGCLLILRRNGTVGKRGAGAACQAPIPAGLSNVTAIAAGSNFALALTSSGRVVAWGDNTVGQTDVPAGLRGVVAIAAGRGHGLALRSDNRVVAWGDNIDGELNIPPGLANVVAIDVGNAYNQALRANGSVVVWGDEFENPRPVPAGLPAARALGAGEWRQAAVVLRDGTIREWGFQEGKALPPGLRNVMNLSMGFTVNYALVSRAITPAEAVADMRVDLAALIAIEDANRAALYADLDLAASAIAARRTAQACTALRTFGARVGDPDVVPYADRRDYFVSQTRDVLRLLGCRP